MSDAAAQLSLEEGNLPAIDQVEAQIAKELQDFEHQSRAIKDALFESTRNIQDSELNSKYSAAEQQLADQDELKLREKNLRKVAIARIQELEWRHFHALAETLQVEFDQLWNDRTLDQKRKALLQINSMQIKHKEQQVELAAKLQAKLHIPKFSAALLDQRKRQFLLAKTRRFSEAEELRALADRQEEREMTVMRAKAQIENENKVAALVERQLAEFAAVNQRLEVERATSIETRRAEQDVLTARIKKTDADLKHAQARERSAAEALTSPVVPVPTGMRVNQALVATLAKLRTSGSIGKNATQVSAIFSSSTSLHMTHIASPRAPPPAAASPHASAPAAVASPQSAFERLSSTRPVPQHRRDHVAAERANEAKQSPPAKLRLAIDAAGSPLSAASPATAALAASSAPMFSSPTIDSARRSMEALRVEGPYSPAAFGTLSPVVAAPLSPRFSLALPDKAQSPNSHSVTQSARGELKLTMVAHTRGFVGVPVSARRAEQKTAPINRTRTATSRFGGGKSVNVLKL